MPDARLTEVNRLVRKERESRDWLQRDLAERCGWSQFKVSRIETGVTSPGFDDLETISRVFGVPMKRLLRLRKRPA